MSELFLPLGIVAHATAGAFGVPFEAMRVRGARDATGRARLVAMYLASELVPTRSLADIGTHFGVEHHTSVLHARQRVSELIARDPAFAAQVADARRRAVTNLFATTAAITAVPAAHAAAARISAHAGKRDDLILHDAMLLARGFALVSLALLDLSARRLPGQAPSRETLAAIEALRARPAAS